MPTLKFRYRAVDPKGKDGYEKNCEIAYVPQDTMPTAEKTVAHWNDEHAADGSGWRYEVISATPPTAPRPMSYEYPEHQKLAAISDKSQAIGDFLQWLQLCGLDNEQDAELWEPWDMDGKYGSVELAYRPRLDDLSGTGGEGRWDDLSPIGIPMTELLARYFDIDQNKIETEKRAMLDELRKV